MTDWWCTYCGDQHAPDRGTLMDDRYALGRCHGGRRQLVRDQREAARLSRSVGKYRPRELRLGVADPLETRRIQGER